MKSVEQLVARVLGYYDEQGRDLPWRLADVHGKFDPYKITVSELMLQQTQVARVVPKYTLFLRHFTSVESLAGASLADVLALWQGLGYNRRAKYLHQAAKQVVGQYGGVFPASQEELTRLPGIGHNTAGAICAYAFNQPVVFIETNIRTVFIHHFFEGKDGVADKDILPLLRRSLEGQNPRTFYWALMDYGTHLKSEHGNAAMRSRHYVKQPRFEGSRRQLRGKILRSLSEESVVAFERMNTLFPDERLESVLEDLAEEGFIQRNRSGFRLAR